MTDHTTRLAAATKALIDAICFDLNGALIGGKWMGGNGGLVSRETIARADEARRALAALEAEPFPPGTPLAVAHDGFEGAVIGRYVTREGKSGLVLQQHGTRIVHVYGEKWFEQP